MTAVGAALLLFLLSTAPAGATEVVARPGPCAAPAGLPADHPPLASTLDAVRAGFAAGADRMVVTVGVTADGQVAVFVDDAACRQHPSLRDLLTAFPDGRFFLDMAGGLRGAGDTMIAYLKAAAAGGLIRPGQVTVYSTGDAAINQQAAGALPDMAAPGLVMADAGECLQAYAERGVFPRACIGAEIPLPMGVLRNMGHYAADVVKAVHAAHGRAHVLGVNSAEDYRFAAALEPDFIWTDRIAALGL
jgi:glycerophosphoryl diester phosphodiesterase